MPPKFFLHSNGLIYTPDITSISSITSLTNTSIFYEYHYLYYDLQQEVVCLLYSVVIRPNVYLV